MIYNYIYNDLGNFITFFHIRQIYSINTNSQITLEFPVEEAENYQPFIIMPNYTSNNKVVFVDCFFLDSLKNIRIKLTNLGTTNVSNVEVALAVYYYRIIS